MNITENITRLKASLPAGVTLVAVSKFHPVEALQEAYNACLLYTSDAADE